MKRKNRLRISWRCPWWWAGGEGAQSFWN